MRVLFGGCDNHLSCEKESEKSDLGGAEGHLGLPLSKVGTSQPSQTHDHVKKATTAVVIFRASLLNQFRPYIRSQLHPSHGADLLVFWFVGVSGPFCSYGRALKASPVYEVLCSATGMCPHFVWAGKRKLPLGKPSSQSSSSKSPSSPSYGCRDEEKLASEPLVLHLDLSSQHNSAPPPITS